ncbi:MAG: hypothetical protein ACLGSA_16475 [Acidobacteriota bacterium]
MIQRLQESTRAIARELAALHDSQPFSAQDRARLDACLSALADITAKAEDQRRGLALRTGVLSGTRGLRKTPQGFSHLEFADRTLGHWNALLERLTGELFIEAQLLRGRAMAESGEGENALQALGLVLAKVPDHAGASRLLDHPAVPRMGAELLKARYRLTLLATVAVPGARYLSDIAAMPEHGRVYVTDSWGDAVHAFDLSGQPAGVLQGLKAPYGLCDSGEGHLMVCDQAHSRIVFFDRHGAEARALDVMAATGGAYGLLHPVFACPCGPDVCACCVTPKGAEYLFLLPPDGGPAVLLDTGPLRQITGLHHADGRLFVLAGKQRSVSIFTLEKRSLKRVRTRKFAETPVKLRSANSFFFLATHDRFYKMDRNMNTIYSVPVPTRPYNNPSSAFARIDLAVKCSTTHLYIVDDMQKGYSIFKV